MSAPQRARNEKIGSAPPANAPAEIPPRAPVRALSRPENALPTKPMSQPDAPRDPTRPAQPDALRERKPWPMWPIGIAIVAFAALYTYVNLEFRKEGSATDPASIWRERQDRKVDKNLYDWYRLRADRAPDAGPIASPAQIATRANEQELELSLPEQLVYYLASRPVLAPFGARVESPSRIIAGEPLRARLWLPKGLADDERFRLQAFYKDGELYLLASLYVDTLADVEPSVFEGALEAADFEIPTDPIEPGVAQVRLFSEGHVSEWQVEIEPRAVAE